MDYLIDGMIVIGLFLASGFFSSSETALFSLTKIERRRLEQNHPAMSRWVNYLFDHPKQSLISVLIGNLLVNILATAIVTLLVLRYWGPGGTSLTLIIFTILLILFGEIMPKTLAVRNNVRFAVFTAIPLRIFSVIILPVSVLTQWLAERIQMLLPHSRKEISEVLSEEDLKAMVKIGEEEGVLDSQERYMIQKLFELGERPVKEIMTPRIDLAALDSDDARGKHIELIQKFHFSHFPVYQGSIDNLLGVVPVQEYLLSADGALQPLLKQPLFIPESKRINDLLTDFKTKRENFAVCVDEYGGTAGIVTLEDILEEIFGEFYDEYAHVENPIRSLGRYEYLVEAKIGLLDFNEFFATHLEAQEASTLGGFILEKLGAVPARGQIISTPECDLQVQEVIRGRRIHRVLVRIRV